jgi:epoxyqueuosine reductase QueG
VDEQSDARKSPVGREFESWFFGGDCVIAIVLRPNKSNHHEYTCEKNDCSAVCDHNAIGVLKNFIRTKLKNCQSFHPIQPKILRIPKI